MIFSNGCEVNALVGHEIQNIVAMMINISSFPSEGSQFGAASGKRDERLQIALRPNASARYPERLLARGRQRRRLCAHRSRIDQ
jgi:hypothetical protein